MAKRELEEGIKLDLEGTSTYADYLQLDTLLSAQQPRSRRHDEMLFIVEHQTAELWMKLLIHELSAAIAGLRSDEVRATLKIFARVKRIQRVLFEQWSVLETLTPSDYLEFRTDLGHASGFQSAQYRLIEFLLGNKDAQLLRPHKHTPEVHAALSAALDAPSLYDEFLRYLARRGYPVPRERLERDLREPYESHPGVLAALRQIYQAPQAHWDAYELSETLVDLEEHFQLWRLRHVLTVQRIIGFRRGTGGSSGVAFLKKALDATFFPELWDVRTHLSPGAPE